MSVLPVDQETRPTKGVSVSARGLTKRFGPLLALDNVNFEVTAGVQALLGENGAGKSTLVKALYGYAPADGGTITYNGEPVTIATPADARRLGIGMVFQQSTLIPAFTVAENIALLLPDLPRLLRPRQIAAQITELADRYGLEVRPDARVGEMSLPEQQRVEVLRVLLAGARVLIFDEPTSTLPAHEIDRLFDVFRKLRDDDYPIVFITHKLHEVMAVADRVTVMRHGAIVGSHVITDVTEDTLIEMMFGAPVDTPALARRAQPKGQPVLELSGACTRGSYPLSDISLTVNAGEIVGVAGITGNGQRELGDLIIGMLPVTRGTKLLFGERANGWSVRRIRERSVGFIPEDVAGNGVIWNMTLAENVALGELSEVGHRHGVTVDWDKVQAELDGPIQRLGLHLPDSNRKAMTLSGGNVQRFGLARELARHPRLLVALYPTRGLDVPSTDAVQELIVAARDEGCGVLLVSHDLTELAALSDRIVVIRDGRLVADLPPDAEPYAIGRLMTGGEDAP